jgi:hypothetical protein
MPPLNDNRSLRSYPIVCREVAAPKRRASRPLSTIPLTPGMAAALRHSLVFAQLLVKPGGLRKATLASSRPWATAIRTANSPMLARERGRCGCTTITRLSEPGLRAMRL